MKQKYHNINVRLDDEEFEMLTKLQVYTRNNFLKLDSKSEVIRDALKLLYANRLNLD